MGEEEGGKHLLIIIVGITIASVNSARPLQSVLLGSTRTKNADHNCAGVVVAVPRMFSVDRRAWDWEFTRRWPDLKSPWHAHASCCTIVFSPYHLVHPFSSFSLRQCVPFGLSVPFSFSLPLSFIVSTSCVLFAPHCSFLFLPILVHIHLAFINSLKNDAQQFLFRLLPYVLYLSGR